MNAVRKVISADSHVIEPPEMWSEYLEVRMKPRAPHIEHGKDDDFYCIDGLEPVKVTVLSAAGVPAEEVKHWRRWDAPGRLKGGWDPVQREKDADRDGADSTAREIRHMLTLGSRVEGGWDAPVLKTVAARGEGVDEVRRDERLRPQRYRHLPPRSQAVDVRSGEPTHPIGPGHVHVRLHRRRTDR